MKLMVFHIRLTKENLEIDQENFNRFCENVTVKKTVCELINGQTVYWSILLFYTNQNTSNQEKKSEKIAVQNIAELTDEEKKIFETFRQWRHEKAIQMNVPSYVICHNKELMTIAKIKPQTMDDLVKIKGFGEQRITKFGDDIIALLNSI